MRLKIDYVDDTHLSYCALWLVHALGVVAQLHGLQAYDWLIGAPVVLLLVELTLSSCLIFAISTCIVFTLLDIVPRCSYLLLYWTDWLRSDIASVLPSSVRSLSSFQHNFPMISSMSKSTRRRFGECAQCRNVYATRRKPAKCQCWHPQHKGQKAIGPAPLYNSH